MIIPPALPDLCAGILGCRFRQVSGTPDFEGDAVIFGEKVAFSICEVSQTTIYISDKQSSPLPG